MSLANSRIQNLLLLKSMYATLIECINTKHNTVKDTLKLHCRKVAVVPQQLVRLA